MLAEIITIGDEILIGQIIDTNSAYISKELNKIGVKVFQITSIQDDREHILKTLYEAQERVDLVIVTGGLGPTKDDITKQTFCEFLDDTLVENDEVLNNIHRIFKKYIKREPLPSNLKQAQVPSSATILQNIHGTAPGMWMEKNNKVFVSLPGVPYEMKYLISEEVLPRVIKRFKRPFIFHKTLLTYGKGESEIAETIEDFENNLPAAIKLAYLPSLGRVRLRLSSTGTNQKVLQERVNSQMQILHKLLEDIAVGYEEETSLETRIATLLTQKGKTLSLAESCTGGAIAKRITSEKGASAYFKGSIIPYETNLKSEVLGVDPKLIEKYNVVSLQVAEAMAQRSQKLFHTDFAISTTGIAGPSKGDGVEDVGTVCIAIASPLGVISEKFNFGNSRKRVITKTVHKALEMLLKEILKN